MPSKERTAAAKKAAQEGEGEGEKQGGDTQRLGAGRTLRVRETKDYKGFDEPPIEEEDEPKKGKKRGRPPKNTPMAAGAASGRGGLGRPPMQQKLQQKMRPFDPPVPADRLDAWRHQLEALPDDAVLHKLVDYLPEGAEPAAPPEVKPEPPSKETEAEPAGGNGAEDGAEDGAERGTADVKEEGMETPPRGQSGASAASSVGSERAEPSPAAPAAPPPAVAIEQVIVSATPRPPPSAPLKVGAEATGYLLQVSSRSSAGWCRRWSGLAPAFTRDLCLHVSPSPRQPADLLLRPLVRRLAGAQPRGR